MESERWVGNTGVLLSPPFSPRLSHLRNNKHSWQLGSPWPAPCLKTQFLKTKTKCENLTKRITILCLKPYTAVTGSLSDGYVNCCVKKQRIVSIVIPNYSGQSITLNFVSLLRWGKIKCQIGHQHKYTPPTWNTPNRSVIPNPFSLTLGVQAGWL